MKSISRYFNNFAEHSENLCTRSSTLTFCFCLAALTLPFSTPLAVGAAVAPTLMAGSAAIARTATQFLGIFERQP